MIPRARAQWTRAADVRAQAKQLWERGELLRHVFDEGAAYPLRLRLKGPSSTELAERFDEVRAWIAELRSVAGVRIEMREFSHRVLGANAVPAALWIDRVEDALALAGKRGEAARARALWELAAGREPRLLAWLRRRPLKAVALAEEFARLLDVAQWACTHPRSGLYLRQVDLPGVDSKFIERHRGALSEWLDLLLEPGTIDPAFTGVSQFAERYGFRAKPTRVRFRVLDEDLVVVPGPACPDVTLDVDSFADLEVRPRRVFVTENETNFLAFPPVQDSLVVFGSGYGWSELARVSWLQHCALHYWGDIDTHGFAILDQLRGALPHVVSMLMDRATLFEHRVHWTTEVAQFRGELNRLTTTERTVFEDLRENRLGSAVRLEQERVGFGWVKTAIAAVIGG